MTHVSRCNVAVTLSLKIHALMPISGIRLRSVSSLLLLYFLP